MSINHFGQQDAPAGYALPKAAVELINVASLYAKAGWIVGWQWAMDSADNPFVTVHVADQETGEYFKYTWHSRQTGTLRLFSKIKTEAKGGPWFDAPSLKAALFRIREIAHQRG